MDKFFREELHTLAEKLRPAVPSGDLEAVFREFGMFRLRIKDVIVARLRERSADPNEWNEGIERQAFLNAAIDDHLREMLRTLIESRTRTIEQAAWRDSLTGLLNRGAFDRQLRHELERARRYHRPLSLVLLDVDRLKSVNDQFGHLAGDEVLMSVARILKCSLRLSDQVFRFGGDEFAALCPETLSDSAANLMKRLEIAIRSWADQKPFAGIFGVSWGIAAYPEQECGKDIDGSDLILTADKQLYLCKKVHHKKLSARP